LLPTLYFLPPSPPPRSPLFPYTTLFLSSRPLPLPCSTAALPGRTIPAENSSHSPLLVAVHDPVGFRNRADSHSTGRACHVNGAKGGKGAVDGASGPTGSAPNATAPWVRGLGALYRRITDGLSCGLGPLCQRCCPADVRPDTAVGAAPGRTARTGERSRV